MELQLYKPYKAQGGWKAVVVRRYPNGICVVYHEMGKETVDHYLDGSACPIPGCPSFESQTYRLIEPWEDPRTFDVNVYVTESVCGTIRVHSCLTDEVLTEDYLNNVIGQTTVTVTEQQSE